MKLFQTTCFLALIASASAIYLKDDKGAIQCRSCIDHALENSSDSHFAFFIKIIKVTEGALLTAEEAEDPLTLYDFDCHTAPLHYVPCPTNCYCISFDISENDQYLGSVRQCGYMAVEYFSEGFENKFLTVSTCYDTKCTEFVPPVNSAAFIPVLNALVMTAALVG